MVWYRIIVIFMTFSIDFFLIWWREYLKSWIIEIIDFRSYYFVFFIIYANFFNMIKDNTLTKYLSIVNGKYFKYYILCYFSTVFTHILYFHANKIYFILFLRVYCCHFSQTVGFYDSDTHFTVIFQYKRFIHNVENTQKCEKKNSKWFRNNPFIMYTIFWIFNSLL